MRTIDKSLNVGGDYVENYPKFYRNPMSYSHFSLYLLNDLVVHVF